MTWQTTASPESVSLDRGSSSQDGGGEGDDRINCLGASRSSPVVCISEIPLKPSTTTAAAAYFEVTVLEGSSLIVGLIGSFHDHDGGGIPGKRANSIGFLSNGDLLCNVPGNECTLPFSSPFGQFDTIGVGVELLAAAGAASPRWRAYATHNGRDLGTILVTQPASFPLYPAVAFEDSFVVVSVRRHGPFLYELRPAPPPPPPPPQQQQPHPPPVIARASSSSEQWQTAVKTAGSAVGRTLSQLFTASPTSSSTMAASQSLEADLLETQEHINLLAGVLSEHNDEAAGGELLREITVACRRLLVRHQNLIRDATDDAALKRILQMNDHIVELLVSADRVLDSVPLAVTPTHHQQQQQQSSLFSFIAAGAATTATANNTTTNELFKVLSPTMHQQQQQQHASDGSLVERGASIKVIEMLHMLRGGTARARKNAATSLAVFVKEELSRELVVANGGVHCLVIMAGKDDAELALLATVALAELTRRIQMRRDQESESAFYLARSVYRAELSGVLLALDDWMDSSSTGGSSEGGEPVLTVVAHALANLVMMSVTSKPMDEQGGSMLLRILQREDSLASPEACRLAAFALAMLVHKNAHARAAVVNHPHFFRVLEWLLLEEQGGGDEENELVLYGVCCLAGLLVGGEEEASASRDDANKKQEPGFAQGFVTARVLHAKNRVLANLMALSRSLAVGAEHTPSSWCGELTLVYLVRCLLAVCLEPSGLLALLDEAVPQDLVDLMLRLTARLIRLHSEAALSTSRTSSGVMDASTYHYSARFDATANAGDATTRRQQVLSPLLPRSSSRSSASSSSPAAAADLTPALADAVLVAGRALLQVVRVVDASDVHFTEQHLVIIDSLSRHKSDDDRAVDLVSLLCSKFHGGDVLIQSTLLDLLRRPGEAATRARTVREIAKLVQEGPFAMALFQNDYATHLCQLVSFEDNEAAVTDELGPDVCSALHGLARVCFTTAQNELFGFEPRGPVLALLLSAVSGFESHAVMAARACRVLRMAVRGRGALAVHYRAVVLKQAALCVSQMSLRCAVEDGRRAAEELLQACGFTFGAFQLVANEPHAIQEWASIKADVEILHSLLDCALLVEGECGGGFFDAAINGQHHLCLRQQQPEQPELTSPPARTSSDLKAVAASVVSEMKQSPPGKWMQQVIMTSSLSQSSLARELMMGGAGAGVGFSEGAAGLGSSTGIAKRLFRALGVPSSSSSSSNTSSFDVQFDLYETCFALHDYLLQRRAAAGSGADGDQVMEQLPRVLQDLFDMVFANVGPLERYEQLLHVLPTLSLKPVRVIRLKNRLHFWSVPLVSTVVQTSLAGSESAHFTLILQSTDLLRGADEKDQLVHLLRGHPSLGSLCLVGNGSFNTSSSSSSNKNDGKTVAQEERIAQVMGALPPSVTWLTLDRNALSAEGLRLSCAFLGVNCGLRGLAITNSTYSVSELLGISRILSSPNSQLRSLDLSSNSWLNDASLGRLCRSLLQPGGAPRLSQHSLTSLDLSGNQVGHATLDALLGLPPSSSPASTDSAGAATSAADTLQRDIRGEAKVQANGLLCQLEVLSLARCSLSADCTCRLLYALCKNDDAGGGSRLRVLDLDGNHDGSSTAGGGGGGGGVVRALVSFLAFNRTITEFGFADNELNAPPQQLLTGIANSLKYNKTLLHFRHDFAAVGASAEAAEAQLRGLLRANRDAARLTQERQALAQQQHQQQQRERPHAPVAPAVSTTSSTVPPPRLQVLFASPLVFRDAHGTLCPLDGLDCDAEMQLLLKSFEEARALHLTTSPAFSVMVAPPPRIAVQFDFGCTTDKLISALTGRPTALHLSTHGEEGYLVLEDGRGGTHALSPHQLEEICDSAQVRQFLRLVVVSACSSSESVAQAFVRAGVPTVVAVRTTVSDQVAQIFTRSFYLSLALGDAVGRAFQLAKQAVRASPACHAMPGEELKFVLLTSEGGGGGGEEEAVFPTAAAIAGAVVGDGGGSAAPFSPDPRKWRLTHSKFLEVIARGRRIDLYLVLVAVASKRAVSVVSPEGFGKSAMLAGFMCKFANDRALYKDGAVVLDLLACSSMRDVCGRLVHLVRRAGSSSGGAGVTREREAEEDSEEEVELTLQELASRHCLLVLDNADDIIHLAFEPFRFFLGKLLDRTKIRLVVATRHRHSLAVPGHEHLVHVLGPLDGVDSAVLFVRNCPHYYSALHLTDSAPPAHFELGLARHPLIADLRGVPKSIVMAAGVISKEDWNQVVEEVVEALMPDL